MGGISFDAADIAQEGLRLPPCKIFEKGKRVQSVFDILLSSTRLPEFLNGDLWAGISAVKTGERRISELCEKYGIATVVSTCQVHFPFMNTKKTSCTSLIQPQKKNILPPTPFASLPMQFSLLLHLPHWPLFFFLELNLYFLS
jgi:hypothetical protein